MLTTVGQMMNRVPRGLSAMLGAGIFAGLAPATSVSGTWVLAALVLAGFLAVLCGLSTSDSMRSLEIPGRVAGASAIAGTFGAYLVPAHPVPAAIGVLVVAAGLTAFRVRPPETVAVIVVLGVLAAFVAACLAIAPAGQAVAPPPGSPGTDRLAGLPVATLLMFIGFLGFDRISGRARVLTIGLALVVYLGVTAAALRQFGGPRLALSPVPLRDALAAADASGIDAMLTVGAAVATVFALLGVLDGLRGRLLLPAGGVLAAAGAALLSAGTAIALASGLMLARYALGAVLRAQQHQNQRDDGEPDGDHERAGVDVTREELPVVAPEPPHRPGDGRAEAQQDAEPAQPDVAEQDQHAGEERRHGRDRGDAQV
jgi:basic amino acid/polyamine antiporter, APA family